MISRRILTLGPRAESAWAWFSIRPLGSSWGAILLKEQGPPLRADELRGMCIVGDPPVEAMELALEYLGMSVPGN
jgi:hypothetical protein